MRPAPINGMTLNKELRDKQMTGVGQEGDPMFAVRSHGAQHAVAYGIDSHATNTSDKGSIGHKSGGPRASEHGRGHGVPSVLAPCAVDCYNQTTNETSQALSSSASDINHTGGVINPAQAMAVRRLTPKECERLQGFPDGYTDVTYRNKPAADGPRYKALGNSMAVPVMAWIGKRIAEVEATDGTHP